MGSFDHGYAGMISLRAVNEWIGVINSNLGGTNRTAYKATKVAFGGGVAQLLRDPRQEVNGIQLPDSTLVVDHTRIDFSQGTVIQDGELTHFAISGDGFFAVHDGASVFFTRDGEFRWTVLNNATILTTASGFTVLGSTFTPGGVPAVSDSIIRSGTGATFSAIINSVSGASRCLAVWRFVNNQALKFSKYGSTSFDNAQAGQPTRVTDVETIQSSLEASNAALNDTLPELSLAQKLFSAVSKIINVHNSDLDITINLIR
jgi:flagellar basal body rod protein FlgG